MFDVSYAMREIERPLGQNVRPARQRRSLPSVQSFVLVFAALGLAAASGAIALRDKPYRMPVSAVTAKAAEPPVTAVQSANPTTTTAKADRPTGGPSIIKVNPEDAGSGNGVVIIRDPAAVGQNLRVAHLPDKALIEDSEVGPLPVRAADGRRPMDVYARPWSGARGARVAIVVGGLGLSQTGTQEALDKLPAEVTIALATNGNSLGRWMQRARQSGHEIMLQVPLEPFDYPNVNPGRNTLTVEAGADENVRNLHWALARTTNYTGIMNYMGARFSADSSAMAPMMSELGKRGLLYLDDGSTARSVAPDLALKNGVAFAAGDAAIDGDRDRGAILKKLDELERTARAKGFAIGTGSAFDVTVDAIASWAEEAKKRGIEIVPVSALVSDPERG